MTPAHDPIIVRMLARLDEIEARLESHRTEMHREWSQARNQRDALGRELDAFNAEMAFVHADVQQLRAYMSNAPRPTDELTIAVDQFVVATKALISDDRQVAVGPFAEALGNLLAVTLGRAAAQAAGAVVNTHRSLEQRIDSLQADVQELQRAVGDTGDGNG